MTKEEKQKAIYVLKKSAPVMPLTQEEFNGYIQAINQVIDWLEQDPILDKIRAEMFEEMLSHSGTGEEATQAYADGLKKGLDILDKYKAESEEINGR